MQVKFLKVSSILLGASLMLVWVWLGGLTAVYAPIVSLDINQHRANRSLPPPNRNFTIEQDFVATHDGLSEVELLIVKNDEAVDNGQERLTVTLFDDTQAMIAVQSIETANLRHNQLLTLQFSPQQGSNGRRYRLELSGTTNNVASVWGYDLDVYADGAVTLDAGALAAVSQPPTVSLQTDAQDLRFITRYQLTWSEAVRLLGNMLSQEWMLLLAALLLLPLPGCVILLLGQRRWPSFDKAAWWGTAVALGVAIWPILWFLFSLVGGRWSGRLLWSLIVGCWLLVVWYWLFAARYLPFKSYSINLTARKMSWHHFALVLILLGGFAVRLLAVRDLAFPAWVDSSRHGLITAVMTRSGQTISDYAPFLPVDRFPYHFGFHTLSASLALMLPQQQLTQLLLTFGQLLNALIPLTMYTAVWLFTRHKGGALFAAFLVAFPFFFPAYYATWGRYTQLTGMIVLPVLIALTWRLIRGGRRWRAVWGLVGILAAGLFLIHFRVFLIYLPFVLLVWGMSLGRNGLPPRRGESRYLLRSGLLTCLLIGIRAAQLYELNKSLFSSNGSGIPNYNAFPTGYYEAGWERYFVWAAAGLLIVLLTAVFRHRRWVALPLALLGWVGVLFILLTGKWLGLPQVGIINLNSMYITLFLPLAIYLAVFLIQLQRRAHKMPQIVQAIFYVAAGVGGMALLLFGVHQQINILNPQTILATAADLEGLKWIDANLPQDANIAVNSWLWLGNTYAGQDGGAWVVPLTGRRSTTPPADYIYDRDLFEQVNGFNETAVSITDWSTNEAADFLHQQAITHIFVGTRGGFFDPAALSRNPQLNLIYSANGVFIFELH